MDQGEKLLRDLMAHPTLFVSKEQAAIALARALIATKPDEARKLLDPLRTEGSSVGQVALTLYGQLPANNPRCHAEPAAVSRRAKPRPAVSRTAPPYRNDFQRDRDRVVHSRAFRRLEAKTQVFTPGLSDYFRNRLTHTMEVSQISRTLAGVLGSDENLTEALALAHDIGHPPFAHAGEEELHHQMRASATNSITTCTRCALSKASSSATRVFPG